MLIAALRDLQWRKRRFAIAIVGTGLVFAMTLVLTGLANGFRVEATRTVDSLQLDAFLVKSGATGPFLGSSAFPSHAAGAARRHRNRPADLRQRNRAFRWVGAQRQCLWRT